MKKTLIRAWVAGLVGVLMAGVASAEVIYVDFYDDGTTNSSLETYNVLHTNYTGGNITHPVATGGGGLSMGNLVDTDNAPTGAGVILHSYHENYRTAANSSTGSAYVHQPESGIATNASQDSYWINDQGRTVAFGFILTFSNLTAEAYDISMLAGSHNHAAGGTWSVTTGIGDPGTQPYSSAQTEVQEWTAVQPVDGTIVLKSVDATDSTTWKSATISFVSLTATEADPNANLAPTADDITETVDEDGSIAITLLGSDPEDDDLTYDLVSQPANGTVTTNGALPDIIYTPDADFFGTNSFTYTVNDGEYNSGPATVTVIVNPVAGDAPVADDLSAAVYANGSVAITLSGTDPDGNTNLSYTVVSGPASGNLSGIAPDLTYTPNADYLGDDSFTYTVNDGETDSAAAIVSIIVNSLVPAGTELILNGDFEQDGYTGDAGSGVMTNWTGPKAGGTVLYDTDQSGKVPDTNPNTVARLTSNESVFQNFNTSWSSNSSFIVNLNACEVWWKTSETQLGNGVFVSMKSAAGKEYQAQLIELDGTHSNITYEAWQTNQTYSLVFAGADLIAGGASANEELRLNIFSRNNNQSINWIDNVSVMMTWGDTPSALGDISIEVVSGGTEVALTWPTREGWNYGVEARENLAFGSWDAATTITNGVPGNGGEVTITIPVSPDDVFYRAFLDN